MSQSETQSKVNIKQPLRNDLSDTAETAATEYNKFPLKITEKELIKMVIDSP